MARHRLEAAPSSAPLRKERSLAHYLGVAVSAAALILVAAVAVLVVVLPLVTGGAALTVLTSSMAPKYPAGSLMVMRPTPAAEVQVGDVLTYQLHSGQPDVVSHRVIQRSVSTEDGEVTFITQGDNNAVPDPLPVREVQVKGTMWFALPLLGWVNTAVNGQARQWVVPIAAGLLFTYGGWTVVSSILARRRRVAAAS